MTLDEAIVHYAEKANAKEICLECAEEYGQLAEWLKELKAYRELFESPKEAEEVLNMTSV